MTTRPRLLVLNERDPEHPRAGGAEIHVARIFGRLAARGFDVTWLATSFVGGASRTTLDGIKIERRGPLPLYYASLPGRVRRATERASRGRDSRTDGSSGTGSSGCELVIECLNKIPFYSPLYANAPTLALCHHLFGTVAFEQASWPVAAGVVASELGLSRAYRHVPFFAISESTASDLTARGIDSAHITVSPPGIDPPSFEVDPNAMRAPRITYVGRLEPYKRVDLMLRAGARLVDRFPDLELLVIGKGSDRQRLETLTRGLGLAGRTRFTGFIEDGERDALLAGTRACAFPSEKEGWGLTVIEANALGTPVVARDAPGLRDSVRHGQTGTLVGPPEQHARGPESERDEIQDWADALGAMLIEDDAAKALRQRCLEWAKHFDWDRAANDMERAITAALQGNSQ